MIAEAPNSVLLFSGGLDSTALAAITRPRICLYVDYGQRPAAGEKAAAERIAEALGLRLLTTQLQLTDFGSGLLLDDATAATAAPSPEWWPFRNQFLATAGAAIAVRYDASEVLVGSVLGDGDRHVDGSAGFYNAVDAVTAMQEGGIRVHAPALGLSTEDLLRASGLDEAVIGWSVSCHRSSRPCDDCPGCWKRDRVLHSVFPAMYG
jgi:7-cyano-7-deazaguanine synthase